MISVVEPTEDQTAVTVQYKRNKKSDQVSTISITAASEDTSVLSYPYTLQDWSEHMNYVLSRYHEFVQLATDNPEMYGAIVRKDAFLEAKKKKEAAKNKNIMASDNQPSSNNGTTEEGFESKATTEEVQPNVLSSPEELLGQHPTLQPTLHGNINNSHFANEDGTTENEDDEYDSDSDDSIEFRVTKKAK